MSKNNNAQNMKQIFFTTEAQNSNITNLIKIWPYITNITCNADFMKNKKEKKNKKIDLDTIALKDKSVKYNNKYNFLTKKLDNSNISANIFSSGTITCCGAKSKEELIKAIKKFKQIFENWGLDVNIDIKDLIIRNIASSCAVNFKIPLTKLCVHLNKISKRGEMAEKPERYPGLIYKKTIENSNICYIFYNSGKITITGAKKEEHIDKAFKFIYPELLKVK